LNGRKNLGLNSNSTIRNRGRQGEKKRTGGYRGGRGKKKKEGLSGQGRRVAPDVSAAGKKSEGGRRGGGGKTL